METFTPDEIKRYARQFPVIGIEGQKRLKEAKVFCIGAGGLGAPALLYLTALGVGNIGIIDDDKVDISNLQRQILYGTADLGLPKARQAHKKLKAQNHSVQFDVHEEKLTTKNGEKILSGCDVIIGGSDNYKTRYLVNDLSYQLNIPLVSASIYQFQGQCSVFNYKKGPCYRCLYNTPPPPELAPNCALGGVLGVLPGIMGCIQATEAIKIILERGETLSERLLTFDALKMQFNEYPVHKNPLCPLCNKGETSSALFELTEEKITKHVKEITVSQLQKVLKENPDSIYLIDVREPYEREICDIGGVLMPSTQFNIDDIAANKEQQIIVYCKSGRRSEAVARLLNLHGYKNAVTLKGGIMQWIDDINPLMNKY